jgi:hypothetical protein
VGKTTRAQERIVGAHFFSPAHIMPLLEIVRTSSTSKQVGSAVLPHACACALLCQLLLGRSLQGCDSSTAASPAETHATGHALPQLLTYLLLTPPPHPSR